DHEEGGDGVGAGEPGGHDDDPGDDGADEPVQVGQHVPERALDVQAGAVGLGQHPGGGHVDDDPGGRDGDDRAAVDGGRVDEAADRLGGDDPADHEQRDPVAGGGQDLRALEP